MMQQDPWAEFRTGPAPQPAQTTAPRQDPVIAPPDPYRQAAEDRADAADRRAQEEAARAASRERRAEEEAARAREAFEGVGGAGTEAQNKAAVLLGRITGGAADIDDILSSFPDAERPGITETLLYGALGPESIIARNTSDWQRRAINDVQRDIVDALLTMGTGAAYNQEQLEAMRVSYFPQYGDSEQEVAFKRRRLQRMIETARLQAGPNAQRLDDALRPLLGTFFEGGEGDAGRDNQETALPAITGRDMYPSGVELAMDSWGRDEVFDRIAYLRDRYGVEPEQEALIRGFWNAQSGNQNLTADQVRDWYQSQGIAAPNEEEITRGIEAAREGADFGLLDTSGAEQEYRDMLTRFNQDNGRGDYGLGSLALQGAGFGFGDELEGLVQGIGAALSGDDFGTAYQVNRDSVRLGLDDARERTGGAGMAAEIGGSLLTGGIRAAPTALRSSRPVAAAAREGAILGGIAGAGYGEGAGGTAGNALLGAVGGAAIGGTIASAAPHVNALLQSGVRRARNVRPDTRPNASEVMPVVEAGKRQNVTVRRADVDPDIRTQRGRVQQTPEGRAAIDSADAQDLAEIEDALARELGGGGGDEYAAGTLVQRNVSLIRDRARNRARREYARAGNLAGDTRIEPSRALQAIDEQIAELREIGANSNKEQIGFLQALRDDLTREGGLTVNALRGQRTGLRGRIKTNNLDATDAERRASIVLDAAADDLTEALRDNPEALSLFRNADKMWREQAQFGERIVRQLVGTRASPVAPEMAARRVTAFLRKDYGRASEMLDQLTPSTRAEIASLVVDGLGRSTNGQFSLGRFLTQTSEGKGGVLSGRGARLLFGEDGMRALSDLRILAQAKLDARSATNYSNTGSLVERAKGSFRRLVLGGFGFSAASGAGTLPGAAAAGGAMAAGELFERIGRERAIRLLLNPDFTAWLRRLPNDSSPKAINNAFQRLRSAASRTPGMMGDVSAFERALVGAVNDNAASTTRAAAEEDQQQ